MQWINTKHVYYHTTSPPPPQPQWKKKHCHNQNDHHHHQHRLGKSLHISTSGIFGMTIFCKITCLIKLRQSTTQSCVLIKIARKTCNFTKNPAYRRTDADSTTNTINLDQIFSFQRSNFCCLKESPFFSGGA